MKPPRYRLASPLAALPLLLALILSGCQLTSVSDSEQIANVETIRAGTPSATTTPTITLTPTSTPTSTPTVGPSPTPTDTPPPSATPLQPTPTPNPAISGFSFCNQATAGASGRFSAGLSGIAASGFPAFEQLVLSFDLAPGSAPLNAGASCLSAADAAAIGGAAEVSGAYTLRVELPNWLRDARYASSPVTQSLSFTTTRTISGASFVSGDNPQSGATLLIGLKEPRPFRLSIERNPTRLIIAVARNATLVSSSDSLRVPAGGAKPALAAPIFYLYDGDVWRADGDGPPQNLSDSAESETALAVSPDGKTLAFCRAAPGLDPADSGLAVPSALWTMPAAGGPARPLAQVGVSCADPAFSLDGETIAFAVDETGAVPTQRAIFTLPAAGGTPQRAQAAADEWSRFAPQWLAGGALIYAAEAQDGRSTLFLRTADDKVLDVGAAILVGDELTARYRAVGRPLASPDGTWVAVEALRSDSPGADTVVVTADGSVKAILGGQKLLPPAPTPSATAAPTATRTSSPTRTPAASATAGTPQATAAGTPTAAGTATATPTSQPTAQPAPPPDPQYDGPYWSRPMAWDAQGRLLYLSTLCASDLVQDYQLYRWEPANRSELLGTGQSLGGFGAATARGTGLAYVVFEQAPPGPRGTQAAAPRSPASLWLWDLDSGARGQLLTTERGIGALAP